MNRNTEKLLEISNNADITKYKTNFGITSKTQDNQHIYMGDIDNNPTFDELMETIQQLFIFGLRRVFVVKSTNGFNLYSLEKMPLKMIYHINSCIPFIDKEFNRLAFEMRKFYVLRIGSDKVYVGLWDNTNNVINRVESNSHRLFFNAVYRTGIYKEKNFDNYSIYQIIAFNSKKHGHEGLRI